MLNLGFDKGIRSNLVFTASLEDNHKILVATIQVMVRLFKSMVLMLQHVFGQNFWLIVRWNEVL